MKGREVNNRRRSKDDNEDLVQKLMQAAEDELLLKLSVNTHVAKSHGQGLLSSSSSDIINSTNRPKGREVNNRRRSKDDNEDLVQKLMQAAEDELLLKLSVNTHVAKSHGQGLLSSSSSDIINSTNLRVVDDFGVGSDSDLNRRFRALKSQPPMVGSPASSSSSSTSLSTTPTTNSSVSKTEIHRGDGMVVDEELKAVLGDDLSARFTALKVKSKGNENPCPNPNPHPHYSSIDEDEDDEVEKLIEWAKDAARLDQHHNGDEDDESI